MAIQLHGRTDFEGERRARAAANKRAYILGFAQPILQSVLGALAQKWAKQPTEVETWQKNVPKGITSQDMFEPVPDAPVKVGEAVQQVSPAVTRGPEMGPPKRAPGEALERARVSRRGLAGVEPPPDFVKGPGTSAIPRMPEVHPERGAPGTGPSLSERGEGAVRLPVKEGSADMEEYRREKALRTKPLEEQAKAVDVKTTRVREKAKPYHAAALRYREAQETETENKINRDLREEQAAFDLSTRRGVLTAEGTARIKSAWRKLVVDSDPGAVEDSRFGAWPSNSGRTTRYLLHSTVTELGRQGDMVIKDASKIKKSLEYFGDAIVEVRLNPDEIEQINVLVKDHTKRRKAKDADARKAAVYGLTGKHEVTSTDGTKIMLVTADFTQMLNDASYLKLDRSDQQLIRQIQSGQSETAERAFTKLTPSALVAVADLKRGARKEGADLAAKEEARRKRAAEAEDRAVGDLKERARELRIERTAFSKNTPGAGRRIYLKNNTAEQTHSAKPLFTSLREGAPRSALIKPATFWSGKMTVGGKTYNLGELFHLPKGDDGKPWKSHYQRWVNAKVKSQKAFNEKLDLLYWDYIDSEVPETRARNILGAPLPPTGFDKGGPVIEEGYLTDEKLVPYAKVHEGERVVPSEQNSNQQRLQELFNKVNAMNVPASSKRRRFIEAADKLLLT